MSFYHSDLCGSRAQSQTCLSYAEMKQSVRSKHLGSASWITDFEGIAVQHLQYLPYGEPYIDQRHAGTTYSERFTFTGKEKDSETGYGYFGARYMDHELMTMWLSVDPMADKYPSISPYAYCFWNPVRLVDSDGRDVYRLDVSDGSLKLYQKTKDNTDKIIAGTYEGIGRAKTFKEAGKSIVFSKGVLNGKKGEDLSVTGFSTYGNNQADGLKVAQFISFQCKKELCGVGFTSAFFTDELDVFGWTENDAYNSNWTMGDLTRTSDEKKLQYFFHTHPNDKNGRGGKGIPSLADTRAAHQLQSVYGISNNYIISQKDGIVGYCEKGIFLGLHTINKR